MSNDQIYRSVIRLNTEDAQNKMEDLKKRIQDLVALRDTIDKKKDSSYYKAVSQQITKAKAELKVYENEVMKTIQTLDNLGNASAKDIRDAQRALQKMIDAKPQGAEEMGDFVRHLQEAKQELQSIATMRAFDEVKAGIVGTGKSAHQLGAEMRFLRETSDNIGTASVQQLEKALEVAREHLKVAKQGSQAYERSSEYIRVFSGQMEAIKEKQKQSNTLIDCYNKELREAGKESKTVANETQLITRTMANISGASVRDLEYSIKALNKRMKDADRSSDSYKNAEEKVRKLRTELERTRLEAGAQLSAWGKFTKFLNDSWGGLTLLIGSVTGLTMTIRRTIEDYAKMEEAMADTRKYTGLTDAAIRELNEDLKKMDTRTSREELNQLAGAAGRLGKTSKQDILEFVEAGNMIKVALGDDLGEGAIDKVGKLAMAFGEDENMGLRKAMLATGSAINELAQNSSANAGYLVDFTARVAGFGKQLGLTQAQIMGFGAVMDENLLQDEMAATAFGNMLTKMQTDTAKFAKIAGMDIKAFADLLAKDANQAVLTLADRLKSVDGQTMMKMLDDMGLDGSRAVAVLATMADKIDDVRRHQEHATEAYREGVSVQKEYKTMNETVEAGIEKAKKQFGEMAVELGERLLPVVRYAISSSAMLIKALSATTGFLFDNIGAITKLSVVLAEYVVIKKLYYAWTQRLVIQQKILQALDKADMALQSARIALLKIHTIALLAHRGAITKTAAAQRILNEVMLKNPVFFLASAVAMATVGIWKLVSALTAQTKEQQLLNDINKTAAERVAEEKAELSSLVRVARDENEQLDKRREAIEKLNSIIPGYNGQLDETTGKYTENVTALKTYNALLREKYRLEAAEDKLKELEKKRFQLELAYEEKMRQSREREEKGGGRTAKWVQGQSQVAIPVNHGEYSEAGYQRELTREFQQQNAELDKQIEIVTGIKKESQEVVNFAQQFNDLMENARNKLEGGGDKKATTPETTASYTSDADQKKAEQERKKREADERKHQAEEKRTLREQSKQLKAETEQRLADLTLSYSQGLIDYRTYLSNRKALQLEGIRERMKLYKEGTAEYIALQNQEKMMLAHGDEERQRISLSLLERMQQLRKAKIEAKYDDEKSDAYHNEWAVNEALFEADIDYLERKKVFFREGSLERMQIEWDIEERSAQHQLELRTRFLEQSERLRQEYFQKTSKEREAEELKAVNDMYDAMKAAGMANEKERQDLLTAIRVRYARERANKEVEISAEAQKAIDRAQLKIGQRKEIGGDTMVSTAFNFASSLSEFISTREQLKTQYDQGIIDYKTYMEAMQAVNGQGWTNIRDAAAAALNGVSSILGGVSAYAQACSDLEVARITANYDKQIEAAGNNEKKRKKLEEKRDKEIKKAKNEANKKATTMQIAQAIASTAANAISAYGAVLIPGAPWTVPLAVAAAAAATASGMLQVATIKKQAQAQEAGYFEGGFTGGRQYRKEAGVVHEGEFVANHQAVNNPNILPFLNFLDQAQRNNTVGSLTMQDVSRSMGTGGVSQVVAPIVNVNTDNEQLNDTMDEVRSSIDTLNERLEEGIDTLFDMDRFDRSYRHYLKLRNRDRV